MCLGAATLPLAAIEGCLQAGVSKAADLVQPVVMLKDFTASAVLPLAPFYR